ncbi:MAG TPA: hypothetical protein VGK54_05575, partial [Chloroflexota bacterium]
YLVGATTCLVGGFFVSYSLTDLGTQYLASIGSLILGLFLWSRNQAYLLRWGRQWRQDGKLRDALKALDDRYQLLVAPRRRLPDFVAVGPMGVIVLIARPVNGAVQFRDNHWYHDDTRPRFLRWLLWFAPRPSLGNPSQEAETGLAATRERLAQRLPEMAERIPTQAAMVFTQPKVTLRVDGCPVPTLLLKSLRNHVSHLPKALNQAEINQVAASLLDQ